MSATEFAQTAPSLAPALRWQEALKLPNSHSHVLLEVPGAGVPNLGTRTLARHPGVRRPGGPAQGKHYCKAYFVGRR